MASIKEITRPLFPRNIDNDNPTPNSTQDSDQVLYLWPEKGIVTQYLTQENEKTLFQILANSRYRKNYAPEHDTSQPAQLEEQEKALYLLTIKNRDLVKKVVSEYSGRGVDHGDLIQIGYIGLLEAISRFDLDKKTRFSTYAVTWLRKFMKIAVGQSGIISFKETAALEANKIKRFEADFKQEIGRSPTITETAKNFGFTVVKVSILKQASLPVKSLESPLKTGNEATLASQLSDQMASVETIERDVSRQELSGIFKDALSLLPPSQLRVLILRYGFIGDSPLTPKDAAKIMGLKQREVLALEAEAISSLKKPNVMRDLREYLSLI